MLRQCIDIFVFGHRVYFFTYLLRDFKLVMCNMLSETYNCILFCSHSVSIVIRHAYLISQQFMIC